MLLEEESPQAAFLAFISGTPLSGKEAEDYMRFLKSKNELPDSSQPFQEYPIRVYHMDGTPRIIQNRREQQALGPQWFQSASEAASALEQPFGSVRLMRLETNSSERLFKC